MIPLSCIALAGSAAYAYEAFASRRDAKRLASPGDLIDVGGHRLHLLVQGKAPPGIPTVIFESGIYGCCLDWQLIQPEVAKWTRAVSYDRAGYGWSDTGPSPRTFDRMTDELKTALVKKGIHPPYLFVGHSLGGAIARTYQARFPEEVTGLVLVDSVVEWEPPSFSRTFRIICIALKVFSHFGALRLLGNLFPSYSDNPAWTAAMQKTYLAAHQIKPRSLAACFAEWDGFEKSFESLREHKRHLQSLPFMVITKGDEKPIRPGLSKEENKKQHAACLAEQKRLLLESDSSELRIAKGSSHLINLDRPDVILEAIEDLCLRHKSPPAGAE